MQTSVLVSYLCCFIQRSVKVPASPIGSTLQRNQGLRHLVPLFYASKVYPQNFPFSQLLDPLSLVLREGEFSMLQGCSFSYDPPLCLLTKLDEALILYKRKSGGPSSLVRRFIGETRAEYARHFSGKMKKMSFSLEKKEKVCIFANKSLRSKD